MEKAINEKGAEAESMKEKYSKADSKKQKEQDEKTKMLENASSDMKKKFEKMKKELLGEKDALQK